MMSHLGKLTAGLTLVCLLVPCSLSADDKPSSSTQQPSALKEPPKFQLPDSTQQPATQTKTSTDQSSKPAPLDPLDVQIDKAIELTSRRQLTAGVHTPWQIMHGILAMRHDFELKKSRTSKETETIQAIEWMGSGALHDNLTLFERTQHGGRARPFTKPYAFEGHANQFFGIFVMSDLPLDHKFKAGPNEVSIADMIENAKMDITQGPEVTWTLWALCHYLPTDAQWHNRFGQPWSIERMVQIQTREAVLSAPCGGTHGLFALSYARNKRLHAGKPLRGVWLEADQKIKRYIEEARVLQNSDGSFSTEYFRGRGFSNEFGKRIAHSGHTLEWLMMGLPQSRLKEAWVRKGLNRLATDLVDNAKQAAECGPLYHALHSLILYRLRTRPNLYSPDKPTLLVKAEEKKPQETKPVVDAKSAVTPVESTEKNSETDGEKVVQPTTSEVTPAAVKISDEETQPTQAAPQTKETNNEPSKAETKPAGEEKAVPAQ